MKPTDRTRALNAAWINLWWLLDPDWTRWAKTLEILADPTARLTIEQGSTDNTARRSKGDHSDPTHAQAAAIIDAGIDSTRQARDLHRTAATIAETASWIRATIAAEPIQPGWTIRDAIGDIAWATEIPHAAAAWTTEVPELRAEMDHAIDHLDRQCRVLVGQCRAILAAAVRERPKVTQPKATPCRCHARWLQASGSVQRPPTAVRFGLCEECAQFKTRNGGAEPTDAILRRWDYGRGATPAQIAEAKAARRQRRRKAV